MKQKIKDHVNLIRDSSTNFIVNTDSSEYSSYIERRKAKNKEHERIGQLESDFDTIKNEIGEIKSLLKELVIGN